MIVEAKLMSGNYDTLSVENRISVDNFIDFLAARQEKHEKELLEAIKECESGECIGPFHSVDELMAELNA